MQPFSATGWHIIPAGWCFVNTDTIMEAWNMTRHKKKDTWLTYWREKESHNPQQVIGKKWRKPVALSFRQSSDFFTPVVSKCEIVQMYLNVFNMWWSQLCRILLRCPAKRPLGPGSPHDLHFLLCLKSLSDFSLDWSFIMSAHACDLIVYYL